MGKIFSAIDWVDLLILAFLSTFSIFLLLTISPALFQQQLFFIVIGVMLAVIVSSIDSGLLVWFAPWGYLLSIILLFLSYLSPAIRGAHRWIFIGSVQLQPSEIDKPFLLLAFSWVLVYLPPRSFKNVLIHLLLFAFVFLLVFRQPDLGSAIVFGVFWTAMMIAAGFPIKVFAGIVIALTLFLPGIWGVLHEYQRTRIITFLNPGLDPKGAGYNALQAMIAVGSGKLTGLGLGRGTQSHLRFLPEFHTDFIFATLVEEFGFFGGTILLASYALLLWRIIRPLLTGIVQNLFVFVYAVGLFTMLLTQIVINSGMNMGIIPITGITLPLVSYGGSSILSLFISFGLLWSFRRQKSPESQIAIGW